ncbi:hypothetical protein LshimejAT787_1204780 [Lyophyllum shimeji]|uniref:Uncharacterized protein n=1 Tax=Lyophyllum shimeji TaxID=47721 RepID=A0A9P3UPQ1_LYOSH|nr:hypothetical protein LshimejAT787_1204780 [Lyophyllum shimeji]
MVQTTPTTATTSVSEQHTNEYTDSLLELAAYIEEHKRRAKKAAEEAQRQRDEEQMMEMDQETKEYEDEMTRAAFDHDFWDWYNEFMSDREPSDGYASSSEGEYIREVLLEKDLQLEREMIASEVQEGTAEAEGYIAEETVLLSQIDAVQEE